MQSTLSPETHGPTPHIGPGKFTFEPVPGTETYDAQAAFKREFPESVNQDRAVVPKPQRLGYGRWPSFYGAFGPHGTGFLLRDSLNIAVSGL